MGNRNAPAQDKNVKCCWMNWKRRDRTRIFLTFSKNEIRTKSNVIFTGECGACVEGREGGERESDYRESNTCNGLKNKLMKANSVAGG